MIRRDEDLGFITNEDGSETPIQVLGEFVRESNGKKFLIYSDVSDDKQDFFVAELVKNEDGEEELVEVSSESDMEFCQEKFDAIIDRFMSENLSDEEEDEEEDDSSEDIVVS